VHEATETEERGEQGAHRNGDDEETRHLEDHEAEQGEHPDPPVDHQVGEGEDDVEQDEQDEPGESEEERADHLAEQVPVATANHGPASVLDASKRRLARLSVDDSAVPLGN
jgi:hypothetical protein